MSNPRRSYVALFRVGIALFAVAFVAGVVRTARVDRSLPPLNWNYSIEVGRLLESGALRDALRQMRIAAEIDIYSTRQVVPSLARLVTYDGLQFRDDCDHVGPSHSRGHCPHHDAHKLHRDTSAA